MTKSCDFCAVDFEPHPQKPSQRFCQALCSRRFHMRAAQKTTWTERQCAFCNEPFERKSAMSHKQMYCTPTCKRAAARALVPQRWRHVSSRYGLSPKTFDEMLAAQAGGCRICATPLTGAGRDRDSPQVDHDHETGQIRAILCRVCNTGLGNFRDDPELVAKAADYLRGWKQVTGECAAGPGPRREAVADARPAGLPAT